MERAELVAARYRSRTDHYRCARPYFAYFPDNTGRLGSAPALPKSVQKGKFCLSPSHLSLTMRVSEIKKIPSLATLLDFSMSAKSTSVTATTPHTGHWPRPSRYRYGSISPEASIRHLVCVLALCGLERMGEDSVAHGKLR